MNSIVVCQMWGHVTEMTWLPVLSGNYIWCSWETLWAGPQLGFWCCCLLPASPGAGTARTWAVPLAQCCIWIPGWMLRNDYSSGNLMATHCQVKYTDQLCLGFTISKYAYSLVRPFSQLSSSREQENKCQCIIPISHLCIINSFWVAHCLKTQ